ncbi:MAG: hypothetical protein DRQ40_05050 [Gammaproteobacteria bacterium]|nr:MAG: hypothetical protein DRQ40_05050 [Gammaproteobacteria bacterium]
MGLQSLVEKYNEAKAKLAHYKKEENALRLELIEEIFPNAIVGTYNGVSGNNMIKGVFKMNHRLDKTLEDDIESLTEAEKDCIVYKPSLSLTNYKKLDESERETLDKHVIVTPALPTITITEAKG